MERPKAMGDKVRAHSRAGISDYDSRFRNTWGNGCPDSTAPMAGPWKNSKHALPLGLGVLPALAAINSRIYRSQQLWLMSTRRAGSFRCGSWAGSITQNAYSIATDYTTAIYTGDVVENDGDREKRY